MKVNFITKARKLIPGFALIFCFNLNAQVLPSDSAALVEFYWASNGPTWTNNSNWLITPISQWYGVVVHNWDPTPWRVKSIDLSNNNLNGTLSPLICDLDSLSSVDFSFNNLSGILPSNIGLIYLFDLYVSHNHFTNPLPLSLGNDSINVLQDLWIDHNDFYGHFPDTILKSKTLKQLYLSNNQFTSTGYFPSQDPLYSLYNVTLDSNKFTFKDLIPYKPLQIIWGFNVVVLSPQDSVLENIDTTILSGSGFIMTSWVDTCSGNRYSWYKNGSMLNWQSTNSNWTINNAQASNSGNYTCMISNPSQCSGVYLWRKTIHVNVDSSMGIGDTPPPPQGCKISYRLNEQMLDITVNLSQNTRVSSNLYDETGRKVLRLFEGTTRYQEFHHPLGWMGKGIYIVKVEAEGKIFTKKVGVY